MTKNCTSGESKTGERNDSRNVLKMGNTNPVASSKMNTRMENTKPRTSITFEKPEHCDLRCELMLVIQHEIQEVQKRLNKMLIEVTQNLSGMIANKLEDINETSPREEVAKPTNEKNCKVILEKS